MYEMKKKILLTWNFIEHKWFAWQRLNMQYEYISYFIIYMLIYIFYSSNTDEY